jgi:putative ABC transport system permease protein
MMPALSASRIDLVRAVKGLAGDGPPQSRLRSAFLVAQVALSMLLLVAAGLAVRSFRHAQSIDRGFDAIGVLTASIDLETRGYSAARGREFIRVLTARLASSAGIDAANVVDIVPLTLSSTTTYLLRDKDAAPAPGQRPPTPIIYVNAVGPGHFRTLEISTLAGRDFTEHDTDAAPPVAIVNETMARLFWPGTSAVGQRLRPLEQGGNAPGIEVVGVVRDSKYVTVGEAPRPFLYRPLTQQYTPRPTVLLRARGDLTSALATLKQEVHALDPGLAVFNVATLDDATGVSLLPARVAGELLGALGLVALALAALGIYGVLSFLVRARTREIGVRVALGASPRRVTMMVVRQAMTWTVAGAGIGLTGALILTPFLKGFLYGISATDPVTFGAVLAMIAAVACVATVIPAVRASRVDPLKALRAL